MYEGKKAEVAFAVYSVLQIAKNSDNVIKDSQYQSIIRKIQFREQPMRGSHHNCGTVTFTIII